MLDDVTSVTLQVAMAGLAQRQQATANNIANLETPGFTASQVTFEQSLADAVAAGNPAAAQISAQPTTDLPGSNGNNVSLDSQFVDATKTTLQTELVTQALTSRYDRLATVLKG